MLGANVNTGRFEPDIDTMRTVITLCSSMLSRLHVKGVIWASLRTRFAADTSSAVKIDDPIVACKQRSDRAYLNTRSIGAVVTPHYRKEPPGIGKRPLFNVLYPRSVNTDRHVVLGLARNCTRMAADTFSVIDYEAEVHRRAKSKFNVNESYGLVTKYFRSKQSQQIVRNQFIRRSVNKLSPKCALALTFAWVAKNLSGGNCP